MCLKYAQGECRYPQVSPRRYLTSFIQQPSLKLLSQILVTAPIQQMTSVKICVAQHYFVCFASLLFLLLQILLILLFLLKLLMLLKMPPYDITAPTDKTSPSDSTTPSDSHSCNPEDAKYLTARSPRLLQGLYASLIRLFQVF